MRWYLVALLLVCVTIPTIYGMCASKSGLSWSTKNGNLLVNGNVYHLKGVNFFGFETDKYAPHGLWGSVSLSSILDVAAKHFNTIRLPFSVEMVMKNPKVVSVNCGSNGAMCQMNALDAYEHVVDECAKRGLLVLIDQHRLTAASGITDLWYGHGYSESQVMRSWDILLKRLQNKWNVFAVDLKNEPHGGASWAKGNRGTDWNSAAERIIKHIAQNNPSFKGLFFVEGVSGNFDTATPNGYNNFWGENLEGVHRHPIKSGIASADNRVVYSPHVYGPDVHMQSYFSDGNFPNNMPKIWDLHWGFVEKKTGHPIVFGEWGGHYNGGKDKQWADKMASYLVDNCMSDQFYWCLNPNSGDTGGILNDDWQSVRTDKLALLKKVQPNPSRLEQKGSKVCLNPGKAANSKCASGGGGGNTNAPTTKYTTKKQTTKRQTTRRPTTKNSGGGGGGGGGISVTAIRTNGWQQDGKEVTQFKVVMKNNGNRAVCNIELKTNSGVVKTWNINVSGRSWTFPSWMRINPGQSNQSAGGAVWGDVPQLSVASSSYC